MQAYGPSWPARLVLVAEHFDIASGKDDRRAGFQAALVRCRQFGAVLVAASLDRITLRAYGLYCLCMDHAVYAREAPIAAGDPTLA